MDLNEGEREFLGAMRAITIDEDGREIYVGLSAAESVEFLDLWRANDAPGTMRDDLAARFVALQDRHEAARQDIVEGRAPLHPSHGARD